MDGGTQLIHSGLEFYINDTKQAAVYPPLKYAQTTSNSCCATSRLPCVEHSFFGKNADCGRTRLRRGLRGSFAAPSHSTRAEELTRSADTFDPASFFSTPATMPALAFSLSAFRRKTEN